MNIGSEKYYNQHDYENNLITDDEVQDVLTGIELKYQINYEVIFKYFKEQLKK